MNSLDVKRFVKLTQKNLLSLIRQGTEDDTKGLQGKINVMDSPKYIFQPKLGYLGNLLFWQVGCPENKSRYA